MIEVARVIITRSITDDGDLVDGVEATSPDGTRVAVADIVSMMVMAEHTVLTDGLHDDDEGDTNA